LAHKFVSSIPGLVRSVPGLALSAPELVEGPDYDRALGAVVAGGLGIERDAEGLRAVGSFAAAHSGAGAELAAMIARSALARTESRGAHQRADFAAADPAQAVRRAWVVAGPAAGAIPREETNTTNTTTEALGAAATGGSLIC
jgi:hypothetical protein